MMQGEDEPLVERAIEDQATRPVMLWKLPIMLTLTFLGAATLVFALTSNLLWLAIEEGVLAIVAVGCCGLVALDYHGFDNYVAWLSLDAWCLDSRDWKGARVASFPIRYKAYGK
jgi:type IV secretory pathway VirB3-like protein